MLMNNKVKLYLVLCWLFIGVVSSKSYAVTFNYKFDNIEGWKNFVTSVQVNPAVDIVTINLAGVEDVMHLPVFTGSELSFTNIDRFIAGASDATKELFGLLKILMQTQHLRGLQITGNHNFIITMTILRQLEENVNLRTVYLNPEALEIYGPHIPGNDLPVHRMLAQAMLNNFHLTRLPIRGNTIIAYEGDRTLIRDIVRRNVLINQLAEHGVPLLPDMIALLMQGRLHIEGYEEDIAKIVGLQRQIVDGFRRYTGGALVLENLNPRYIPPAQVQQVQEVPYPVNTTLPPPAATGIPDGGAFGVGQSKE